MSSRFASKTTVVPPVISTLGEPQLMFLRKADCTTDPTLMRNMPSLNTCQRVRSELYKMQEGASDEVQQQYKPVARWQNFGTFSRDDIAYFIQQYQIKATKNDVQDEEAWFGQLLTLYSSKANDSIVCNARTFMEHIWMSSPNSTVFSSGISAEQISKLCCDRWLSCDIIDGVFAMINQSNDTHYFAVCTEALIHSVRAQQRLCSTITNKLPQLKYIHFALNVKRINGNVFVGNGNHWTYFVFSTSLDELYYGDSLGWNLPSNLLTVMKPVFEALYTFSGKSFTKPRYPVLMHQPGVAYKHKCGSSCFKAFPLQTCGSACGLTPVFMAAIAGNREELWKHMITERTPNQNVLKDVRKITGVTQNSPLLRAAIMGWFVSSAVTLDAHLIPPSSICNTAADSDTASPSSTSTEFSPSAASKTSPSNANTASPSAASKASPSNASKASPSAASKASPSNASKASPSAASKASPSNASKASPSAASKASPSNANTASPSAAISKASPSNASKASPSAASKATPSNANIASPSAASKESPSNAKTASPSSTSTASRSDTSTAKCTASPSVILSGKRFLPFPGVSKCFYKQQGEIWAKNNSRNLDRTETIWIKKNGETIGKCKERNKGTLEENIAELEIAIGIEKRAKRVAELKSIVEVAREIISCLVVPTHGAFDLYWKHKNFHLGTEHKAVYRASDTFVTLSQHLNIAQVIVCGKAYLCEAHNTDIIKLQETLTLMTKEHSEKTFSSEVRKRLNNSFQTALSCLDTKKDRDIFMGIFAHLTSATNVMRLRTLQRRRAIVRQAVRTDSLFRNYESMKTSVLSVRNDMTNKQQQEFERKKLRNLSAKYFKSICDGRGRRLKCEEFPELPALLEYAVGQQDVLARGGRGLEAHSKLYENTLYKAIDNKTIMREARDVILALADENFDVSLSCLYTYTMNYKKGTNQAKRHHVGRNVNAKISLHKASSTGDFKHPVNAHWSTSHANFICDEANQYEASCMIDSKDAKCIINGELPPVLKPGKTWKKTLQVKEVFIFVVDNGPSEAPASTIVQMLLARLVKFLNLDKAVQRSFAEYLSKRNFVERCHAAENKGLERHEPFSSKQINPFAVPGTDAHKENMEKMATDVRAAIDGTMFNKEPIRCFRGLGDRLVFNDEEGLKYFYSLCNDRKESCDMHYSAVNNDILDLAQKVFYPKPSQDILSATAFLAWIPRHQAEEFFTCGSKDAELLAEEDNSKEFWSKHSLFIENTREELVAICSSKKLLETGKKHELVERIVKATEGESSWKGSCDIYSGSLSQVPSSVAQLNKQPVRFLRAVLRFHGFCPLGTKDELIIRVGLLKGGQIQTAFSRERMELVKRISILRDIYKLLDQEKETKLYIHKRRTFGSDSAVLSTRDKCGLKKVVHEDKLDVQGTVSDILDRLEQSLLKLENAAVEKIGRSVKSRKEMSPAPSKRRKYQASEEEPSRKSTREKQKPKKLEEGWVAEERELITKVGARIHVLWTENELRGTKFKPGWYEGEVQQYDDDNDVIRVLYKDEGMAASSRAKNLFDLSVTVALAEGLITLKRAKTY
ncbi:unnamed protein product [Porites lobata]|uniref:Ubiquitin-like protease family profile domain-containing protein n=1 Tax=Porites lobata TaxID=104759 RepID=A0ABN8QJM4_9CNID|nr:unnamed protein product [Porites lobata]